MQSFLDFLTDYILRNPPVLLGIIAAIGLIIQRKILLMLLKDLCQQLLECLSLIQGLDLL